MVSAISPAQYAIGPKTVAALVALDFGQSLYLEVTKAIGPDFKGGHVATGLGTGVIDFVLSPVWQEQGPKDLVEKAKAVWPEIEKAKADIMSGALKVEFKTEL
jgi:basic membrane protein A